MARPTIVVVTIHPWNVNAFRAWKAPQGYKKVLINRKKDLTHARLQKLNPRYVFFPHWSWLIPSEIYKNFECVVFHMTDLPFGRGGSPMQNLIMRGIYKTKVSAIRVDGGLDTGPVYRRRPLDISEGSAEELYKKLTSLCFSMMSDIVKKQPKPKPQKGKVVAFKRRTPEMSKMPARLTMRQIYDFIRMLDAPGYPPAFIQHGGVRIGLRNARLENGRVSADAEIISKK